MYRVPELSIGGVVRRGRGLQNVEVINPGTEEVLGEFATASSEDVADALRAAQEGFARWRAVHAWKRTQVLRRISGLIQERLPEIARLVTLEVGKPLREAELEVLSAVEHFDWAADEARRIYGYTIESRGPDSRYQVAHEPIGIVLALTAWNFPINLAARKLCMALAAGCSVIIRPAGESPASIAALVQCCIDGGLPAGAVNLLFGTPEAVIAPLMAEPSVRKVSFTGSTRVGRMLIQQSADTVKRLTMELGGHAPVLILEDADVEAAAKMAGGAKFRNAGQVCTSPSRFYVHESVAGRFTQGMADFARSLHLGDGLDPAVTMGPLATARQRDRAEYLVENARQGGAKIETGGNRPRELNRGYFFEPTVLSNLDPSAAILNDEPFAPVAPIVPFSRLDDVIEQANGLQAGLAAYVFTRSQKASRTVSERLNAGVVGVNVCAVAIPEAPFGGVKESGFGREGGATAIHDYLNIKFTHTHLLG